MVGHLPSDRVNPQRYRKPGFGGTHLLSQDWEAEARNQKFKVTLSYIRQFWMAWAT